MFRKLLLSWIAPLTAAFALPALLAAAEPLVSVVSRSSPAPPAAHGLGKLMTAFRARGIACEQVDSLEQARGSLLVVAGLSAPADAAGRLLEAGHYPTPQGPEALVIQHAQWQGKPALVVAGADARGLMYAELEVAERVGWSADPRAPLSEVPDLAEKPAVRERAVSFYTMNRACWESRFYDDAYWARYLDLLAQNRFNSVVVIFGYENGGFLAPPYPYFFDVPEFPQVRMVGITAEQQQRNLAALNRLIRMAHDRGLRFTVGIWDHIYRGGVQGGGIANADEATRRPVAGLVWGVTENNLISYTKQALAKFLHAAPNLDAVQFRMHDESGLKNREQADFWRVIFQVMKENAPHVRFDARAKGLPDAVIQTGLDSGVNLRLTTKYWMEQLGLPFHPTHINRQNQFDRRHSYADLLRYPPQYHLLWRLWNGGTARVLLWADPDYVRRFAESTHLYDGDGFEVNEPLATKMEAQPHDARPFDLLNPPYRYYDWEFERYWHFFQVFGRLGYSPNTNPEVWQHEFQKRFGREAAPFVERGLHLASRVLPRIVAACYPYGYFPMTRGWAEKQRLGDLPAYAKAEGSDIQQFANFDEEAQNLIEGGETAKIRPPATARWFAQIAGQIEAQVAEAQPRIGLHRNREFDSTIVDLRILANLALYHSRRIPAAVSYCLFKKTQDLNALGDAIAGEREAVAAWRQLVVVAGDVYAADLMMGVRSAALCGHWRDELAALEKGLLGLEEQQRQLQPSGSEARPFLAHVPVRRLQPGAEFVVRATVAGRSPVRRVRVAYRGVAGEYQYRDLGAQARPCYRSAILLDPAVQQLEYFLSATDENGQTASWPPGGPANPIRVMVTNDQDPPTVIHQPITSAPADKPLEVQATVRDPAGVKWVRLRYRNVNQHLDYQTLPMLPTGEKDGFRAVVPAAALAAKWDFMYLIEVMDNYGNGAIYPDLNRETPYLVVKLLR